MAKKQSWSVGSLFLVPQNDGLFSLGQVLSYEPQALNSIVCAYYDVRLLPSDRIPEQALSSQNLIAILFTTRDLLDSGKWSIVDTREPCNLEHFSELTALRESGFRGTKVIGSGIVTKFLNAYYKLHPWDAWHDPHYLDRLLISPDRKPRNVVITKEPPGGQ